VVEIRVVESCLRHEQCARVPVPDGLALAGGWHFAAHEDDQPHWIITGPEGQKIMRPVSKESGVVEPLLNSVTGMSLAHVALLIAETAWPDWQAR
jgi:hypothetical protein